MGETIDIAERLSRSPDLLPWVITVAIGIVLFKERDLVKGYFKARMEYWQSRKETDALLPELVRNNTAAMTMCTEAFKSWQTDRGTTRAMLEHHEKMSEERDRHIQEVVNRIDSTVTANSRQIGLIEDRTDGKK